MQLLRPGIITVSSIHQLVQPSRTSFFILSATNPPPRHNAAFRIDICLRSNLVRRHTTATCCLFYVRASPSLSTLQHTFCFATSGDMAIFRRAAAQHGGKPPEAATAAVDVEKTTTTAGMDATTATKATVSSPPEGSYAPRPFYKKVPFLNTTPRPYISNAADPKVIPEHDASWWSIVWFNWCNETLTTGYTRPLDYDDLCKMPDDRTARVYADRLDAAWKRREDNANAQNAANQKLHTGDDDKAGQARWPLLMRLRLRRKTKPSSPSLVMAMNDTVFWYFWVGGLMKLISNVGQIASPLMLRAIVDFVQSSYDVRDTPGRVGAPSVGVGIGLGLGLFLVQLVVVMLNVHHFYRGCGTGILLRTALIHAIYRRAMSLSNRARTTSSLSTSKLVTLISSDVSRIDFCCQFFHMGWTAVVQVVICFALQVYTLGYSALPGFAFIVIMSPVGSQITRHLFALRKRSMKWTDSRVKAITELVSGIRMIKAFAWEQPYLDKIEALRSNEVKILHSRLNWKATNIAIAFGIPTLAAVFSLVCYVGTGHGLNAGVIFSALTFFQLLRTPLQFLPISLNAIADAVNAAHRIEAVFTAERQPEGPPRDASLTNAVEMDRASFTWEYGAAQSQEQQDQVFQLNNVSLCVPRGSLVAVVGVIGSGKTSLMNAMTGEMRRKSDTGTVKLGGSVAMCSQTPWILSASVRENILFGRPYDKRRYESVVQACCLQPDLAMLRDGDETIVGEKGISLSGGQRQRVNIARAVYHDDDIVLLDDCLSALDAHVGDKVFRQVVCGLLREKTRIMATHALHLLPTMDKIITLEHGQIAEQGTFGELMQRKGAFAAFVDEFGQRGRASDDGKEGDVGPSEGKLDQSLHHEGNLEKSSKDGDDGTSEQSIDSDNVTRKTSEAQDEKSASSATAPAPTKAPAKGIMQAEELNRGSVNKGTYSTYLRAGKMAIVAPFFLSVILVFQGSTVLSPLWLLWWQEGRYAQSQSTYMGVYALLGIMQSIGLLLMGQVFAFFTANSSRTLHARAIKRIAHAPIAFFDTTPIGRITHRFSKDIDALDNVIGDAIRTFIGVCVQVLGSVVLIAYLTPYFLLAVALMAVAYVWTGMYYRISGRELRRLDAVLRSKIYEHFSESITGVSTIRAYNESATFLKANADRIDVENRAYWMAMAGQRWLSIRLDGYGSLLVLAVAMLSVGTRFTLSPGQTGVALSYILTAQSIWSYVIRQSAEIENNFSAVERIVHYATAIEQEADHQKEDVDKALLHDKWPAHGRISFRGASAAHRRELPDVLRGISLDIAPGEHIAIVGRTGAGKSTLVTTLLRIMELSNGAIDIDGVDISTIGLATLRHRISFIPQEALLFSGSLRYNLDPLGQYDDARLNDAIQRACLTKQANESTLTATAAVDDAGSNSDVEVQQSRIKKLTLDSQIEEDGANLSVGQRSLVSLARALVRDSQIVLLDEATASVDYSTDAAIQKVINEDMKHKTIITVAHRLNTILGYDRVCVMADGKIVELDTPLALFDRGSESEFRRLCESSNIQRQDVEAAQMAGKVSRNTDAAEH